MNTTNNLGSRLGTQVFASALLLWGCAQAETSAGTTSGSGTDGAGGEGTSTQTGSGGAGTTTATGQGGATTSSSGQGGEGGSMIIVKNCDGPFTPPGGTCGQLDFGFGTQQACTLGLTGAPIDGEGFINVAGTDFRVLVLNRWGLGRIIGWCDATTTRDFLGAFDVVGYLGKTVAPKVASFGKSVLCEPGANPSSIDASQATYIGTTLPAQYVDNPALLANDWDVLIYCGLYEWDIDYTSTLKPYVECYGKGILAVMDYRSDAALAGDFDNINALVAPAGFAFEPTSIDWASGAGSFSQCVPGVTGG